MILGMLCAFHLGHCILVMWERRKRERGLLITGIVALTSLGIQGLAETEGIDYAQVSQLSVS
jgi:hypothetical protein